MARKIRGCDLAFTAGPLSNDTLRSCTAHLPRIENYETEINLDAPGWIRALAEKITRGYMLTIDYGYPRDLFYSPDRRTGTLACHRRHRRSNDPLEHIGDTDITAHVDFTSLAECAAQFGFECAGFTDQHHFMVGLGKERFRDSDAEISVEGQKELRAFNALMHPCVMGLSFKVLALQKHAERCASARISACRQRTRCARPGALWCLTTNPSAYCLGQIFTGDRAGQ